jgi:hypothetical protein
MATTALVALKRLMMMMMMHLMVGEEGSARISIL